MCAFLHDVFEEEKRSQCNENRINTEEESDGQGDQKGIRGKL